MSLDGLQKFFVDRIPHSLALGMRVIECAEGRLVFDLPYQERLTGDRETGACHNGAITTLIDSVCGGSVLTRLAALRRTATLDLRVDFLRPARRGQTVRCEAICHHLTSHLALVRALAHDGDPADALATAAGMFAVFEAKAERAS